MKASTGENERFRLRLCDLHAIPANLSPDGSIPMHSKVVYLAPEVLRCDEEFPGFKFECSSRRPVTNAGDRAQNRGWPFLLL